MGGPDFWCNGLHLNVIEAAESPADESWRNIQAMDDLARAILTTESHLTLSALQGNAGAGGVFLALAADRVVARSGVVLNPHYQNMGNLYGSEYWTYLLPRRVGKARARSIMENRLPLGATAAKAAGLIDDALGDDVPGFRHEVERLAESLAQGPEFGQMLEKKRQQRLLDELQKPLEDYRREELEHMKLNFYGFDPSYHVARYHFVHKVPHSWTPLHLAQHRTKRWAKHWTEREE
jgi:putative two-component system hydrogenase maturation factor HypX/HoxX